METLLRDVRHALRCALRQPGVSLVIVFTLAVGIGANTAIFTYLVDLYWQKIEAPDPDRLFFVRTGTKEEPGGRTSYLDALVYRDAAADLGELAPWTFFGALLGPPDDGETVGKTVFGVGTGVSPEHFDFFGVRFPLGRGFLPEEHRPDGPRVAVIDHTYWRRHLGADPAILGRTLRVNGVPFTVVGVLPRGFENTGLPLQVYVPMPRIDELISTPRLEDRGSRRFHCLFRGGRHIPLGDLRETVEARLAVVARNLDDEHPWPRDAERHITLIGVEERTETPRAGQLMLAGAVGLLLLLACANVANLLLARAAGRQREIAVLAAIGASRGRIALRLLTESVLLATLGGGLGLGVSRWIIALIKHFHELMPVGYSNLFEGNEWLEVDHRVLLFTLIVSVATGCVFGLAPVLHAMRADLVSALKSTSATAKPGRRWGARQLLVVTQVTLSTVLLLGAALLVVSLRGLRGRDLGFDTEHQLLAALATAPAGDRTAAERREVQRQLYELGRRQLAALPGVEAATLTAVIPGSGPVNQVSLVLPERPDESFEVDRMLIGPDFFATFSVDLVRGRRFGAEDRTGGVGAVIVNQAFAERFWDSGEVLGRELLLPDEDTETAGDRFIVVGVAPDIRHGSRLEAVKPLVYLPLSQLLTGSQIKVVARTTGPPSQLMHRVREALATAHPDLALVDLGTYDRQVVVDLYEERLFSSTAGVFSLLGLGLACLGIYSVMSCAVSYRQRELGIRMALGANARDVMRLVLGETSGLLAAGILIGVASALVLARLLTSLLYGVAPHDPATFLALPPLLATVGLAAAWLPARRAGRVDPKIALQEE